MRENAGYTITLAIPIGNVEFVLGENPAGIAKYVTWERKNGDNYYWWHYTTDKLAAMRDLLNRASTELAILEAQQELHHGKAKQEAPER